MAQINGHRFGNRSDVAVAQFVRRRLENLPSAGRAIGGPMDVFGYDGAGLQYDVFLDLDMKVFCRLKAFMPAVRANGRGIHRYGLIDPVRLGPFPSRMSDGSSAFAGRCAGGRVWRFYIGLELQPVLLLQPGPEIGNFFFQLLVPLLQRFSPMLYYENKEMRVHHDP